MKKPAVHSRSGIFLMEIIIAILFFSLVSAVCLQAFVNAHTMSGESARLTKAVSITSSMAELAQAADRPGDVFDAAQKLYAGTGKSSAGASSGAGSEAGTGNGNSEADSETVTDNGNSGVAVIRDNKLSIGFDEDWNACAPDSEGCAYVLTAVYTESDKIPGLVNWEFAVLQAGDSTTEIIYELKPEVYYGE